MVSTLPSSVILQLDALASPPGIVVTLILLAVVVLVGRFVLAWAWRLIWIAIGAIVVLWLLGVLGLNLGVL
jgi:hypothetical protein